ncbi:VCBS repeat-containing protein [Chitinimonas arctica]|uniref:VCBS repeat-containing protein n=1 Tax=Chitinimonas arctica TaxID=2594795 RepID=A0A516SKF8_9NEIS|nr:VCBS repeat-containing protein [Chitinimonas arctica]QDQ28647.1 VCBS repeat-containing protein [Chitinimonas arctica]
MKIQQSQVQLAGQHEAARQHSVEQQLRVEIRRNPPPPPDQMVELSSEARAAQQADAASLDIRQQLESHPLWHLIKQLVKNLTGRDIDITSIAPPRSRSPQPAGVPAVPAPDATASAAPSARRRADWRADYQYHEVLQEVERSRFAASGHIVTEDGRRMAFSAVLELERQFRQESNVHISIATPGMRKDPLVLNYAAPSATLSHDKIAFDLDADGSADHISFLETGSGFLALDRNEDGAINDGRELFGAQSGNGFADLAEHDDDRNGWIDENDAVWGKLQLWTRDASGRAGLVSLEKLGIGAIYLGNTATEFALNDENNRTQGQIRRSGVYLSENGRAGTVQQVDLTV